MIKVSFIVPVYNTGKYIDRCLNSIIDQTINENIEIVIVNDGSTDNSEDLIKNYIRQNGMRRYNKILFKAKYRNCRNKKFWIKKSNR